MAVVLFSFQQYLFLTWSSYFISAFNLPGHIIEFENFAFALLQHFLVFP